LCTCVWILNTETLQNFTFVSQPLHLHCGARLKECWDICRRKGNMSSSLTVTKGT
jgi:hypothetical protein